MYKDTDFKLKLIFPCAFKTNNPYSHIFVNYLPYGMGILTAFLREYNYYVEQEDLSIRFNRDNVSSLLMFKNLDLNIDRNKEQICEFLKSGEIRGKLSLFIDKILDSTSIEGFDLIGFSIFSYVHFMLALLLSRRLKQRINTPIVFGGPFISPCTQLYPEIFDFVDYMIVGDGRIPLLRLIDYLKNKIIISDVPGLTYRDNGKLITNPKQHYPIEDMPMPDFEGLPMELYKTRIPEVGDYIPLPYQISRGCSSKCSFCYNTVIDKLEFKSYGKVLSELCQMKERYNSKMFFFCDDTINNSYEYLEGLCDLFIKNRLNINWNVYAKVGNLDKDILRKMREAGCWLLKFGIESGSNRILKMMNKGFTSEQANKTLRDSYEAGIRNLVLLIAGYPHERQEDLKQTLEFIRINKKYIYYINIYRFVLIYGTAIYFNPERYGVTNLIPTYLCYSFAFDESGGLKWKQKEKQQEYSKKQMIKAVHRNIQLYNKYKLFVLYPFTLFRYIIAKIKTCFLI